MRVNATASSPRGQAGSVQHLAKFAKRGRVGIAGGANREIVALIEILEGAFDAPPLKTGGHTGKDERADVRVRGGEALHRSHPHADRRITRECLAAMAA